MTKNEYIASIMLEAANLLKEDNYDSLNEGINGKLILNSILALSIIGGGIYVIGSEYKKEKERKLDKKNKKLEELKNKSKIKYTNNTFHDNQFIESISKKTITINNDDELRDYIIKDIHKLVSACNKDSKTKEKIKESLIDYYGSEEEYKKNSDFKGLYVEDELDCISIINGNRIDRSALNWLVDDMIDVLEKKWHINIDNGDTDNGCIYI